MEPFAKSARVARRLVGRLNQLIRRKEDHWGAVHDEERSEIESLRALEKMDGTSYWGLAHSGGGIRSAAFSIGVQQALEKRDLMRHFDFLSTVSGGGYTGSALTWFLCRGFPSAEQASSHPCREDTKVGCRSPGPWSDRDFPFGQRRAGDHGESSDRNVVLNFIRQHGKYLTPSKGLNLLSALGVVVQGMFASLIVYGMLLISFFSLAIRRDWYETVRVDETFPVIAPFLGDQARTVPNLMSLAVVALAVIVLMFAVGSSLRTFLPLPTLSRYGHAIWRQKFVGGVWVALFGTLVLAAVGPVAGWLDADIGGAAASVTGTLGAVLGFFQFNAEQHEGAHRNALVSQLRIYVAVALLLFGLLLGTFLLGEWYASHGSWSLWWPVVIFLVLGLIVDLNYVGPHRMYRNRLMETFMPDADRVVKLAWGRACAADRAMLSSMRGHRPYHLINTNLVLVDSNRAKFRGRGGDSFVLSPLYCGGEATGWIPTEDFGRSWFSRRGMTLPTAMAVSAAAVNPNAGVAGAGVTRNRLVSLLMGLLNLRLGYWVPHPRRKPIMPPNFVFPGLLGGLMGSGLHENARHLELTDGGHFENLALYELFRRKVEVIVVTDGGADAKFKFSDLANALERARVDFGTKVRFCPEKGLDDVRPGSASQPDVLPSEDLSCRGYAVARVWYPGDSDDEPSGVLFYLKTTLVPDLPADVIGYRKNNPAFPDQSTADQFFDEAQFEAYRELGYQLADRMLDEEPLVQLSQAAGRRPWSGLLEPPGTRTPEPE